MLFAGSVLAILGCGGDSPVAPGGPDLRKITTSEFVEDYAFLLAPNECVDEEVLLLGTRTESLIKEKDRGDDGYRATFVVTLDLAGTGLTSGDSYTITSQEVIKTHVKKGFVAQRLSQQWRAVLYRSGDPTRVLLRFRLHMSTDADGNIKSERLDSWVDC
jgi:hypothetical protein